MTRRNIFFRTFAGLCCCILFLTACSSAAVPEPTPMPTVTPSPTATPTPSPVPTPSPTPEPAYTNPLTGEPANTDYSSRRPVAVMVENNHYDTMIGQGGISQADIIYEMQVENITRNMAVFMDVSSVPAIYPIRSARSYFVSTALAYDAIYVHCGFSAEGLDWAYSLIDPYYTANDDFNIYEGYAGWRINEYPHVGEHGMATSGELLTQAFLDYGTRTEHLAGAGFDYGLHFSENAAPVEGAAARNVRIVFPENKITEFSYSDDLDGYTSTQWYVPLTDDNTGEPVVFENLLVLAAPTQTRIDAKAHSAITTANYQGAGWFINGGFAERITWSRAGYEDCFHYYDAENNELALGIGKTYIAFTAEYYGADPQFS